MTGAPEWSESEITLLRADWARGLSAGQIAKKLSGRSRNAVIGKIHRLGPPKRLQPCAKPRSAKYATRSRPVLLPRLKPYKPPVRPKVHIAPSSPEAQVAAAILAQAHAAEQRRQAWRESGVASRLDGTRHLRRYKPVYAAI